MKDPLSVTLNTELGCNSYYQRRYDVAIAEYRRSLQLDASNVVAYWGLGRAYAQTREYNRALSELRRVAEIHGGAPRSSPVRWVMCSAWRATGPLPGAS